MSATILGTPRTMADDAAAVGTAQGNDPPRPAVGRGGARAPRPGAATRARRLVAVEAQAADLGFHTLTHRLIAQRADAHVALLNYHFGSKEQLVEEALARRADRLMKIQNGALAALRERGTWTAESVLWSVWQPFAVLDDSADRAWRNYLCTVARLASHPKGDELFSRHFAAVERECLAMLHPLLPALSDEELTRGLRYCRLLFERELIGRCNEPPRTPAEQRERSERLIAFMAGGLHALERARTTVDASPSPTQPGTG
jgi:AcrR family transcriptional regulator